ncbi:MAG: 2-C-methyl-D-erythritol 2,4-cyclodiphosphate synthase [Candidatus Eisenbacteria bacterium]
MIPRVGIGYDVHPFADGRALVLGGETLPGARGLAGHSDADALCHAIADALLGALALGDLGAHFPDTDPQWQGASSLALLAQVAAMVAGRGYAVGNVDATVLTEAPKLAPHVPAMRSNLARALGIGIYGVSVKATRPEGLGSLGRGEGLAVWAVAMLVPRADGMRTDGERA